MGRSRRSLESCGWWLSQGIGIVCLSRREWFYSGGGGEWDAFVTPWINPYLVILTPLQFLCASDRSLSPSSPTFIGDQSQGFLVLRYQSRWFTTDIHTYPSLPLLPPYLSTLTPIHAYVYVCTPNTSAMNELIAGTLLTLRSLGEYPCRSKAGRWDERIDAYGISLILLSMLWGFIWIWIGKLSNRDKYGHERSKGGRGLEAVVELVLCTEYRCLQRWYLEMWCQSWGEHRTPISVEHRHCH